MPPSRTAIKWIAAFVIAILYVLFWRLVMPPWPEENGTNFLRALAEVFRSLQWPLVALIVAMFFRQDIRKLLERMRSFKGPGIKGHFGEALDELTEATTELAEAAPPDLIQPVEPEKESPSGSATFRERMREAARRALRDREPLDLPPEIEVLRVAASSPRAALMLLSAEIDTTIRQLAEVSALADDPRFKRGYVPPSRLAGMMVSKGLLNPFEYETLNRFRHVRNAVVHEGKGNDDEVRRAIDSGLILLNSLSRRLPLNRYDLPQDQPDEGGNGEQETNSDERSSE